MYDFWHSFCFHTSGPCPSRVPWPLMAKLSTFWTSIQLVLYALRSPVPSRLPSRRMMMEDLQGPLSPMAPVRKLPAGITIFCVPVASHAFFHALRIACVLSVLPSPLAPSCTMSSGPAGTDGAPPAGAAYAAPAAFVAGSSSATAAATTVIATLLLMGAISSSRYGAWYG